MIDSPDTETSGIPENTEALTPAQQELARALFECGAILFGEFTLKKHPLEMPPSPTYIDLRVLQRFPNEVKEAAVATYIELLEPLEFDLLAGIPIAATTLTSSISDRLGIGMVTPRIDRKAHGSGAKVDGLLPEDQGKTVVLIDDLITSSASKIEAIRILEGAGTVVKDVVVLIDREQGGLEQLKDAGYTLHYAMTMGQMLSFYWDSGLIDQNEYVRVVDGIEAMNDFSSNS